MDELVWIGYVLNEWKIKNKELMWGMMREE